MQSEWTHYEGHPHEVYSQGQYPGGAPNAVYPGPSRHFSSDLITTSNNPGWRKRTRKSRPVGGNFHVVKREYSEFNSLGSVVDFSKTSNPHSAGDHVRSEMTIVQPLWNITNSDFPPSNPSPTPDLQAFGRKAIAAVNPTNSSFDGATFIGELRQGFPRALGLSSTGRGRALTAKNAGSEYLNVEFGWRPLLRDIDSFMHTANNSARIWEQYKRNCGKLVKRSYAEPESQTITVTNQGSSGLLRPTLLTGMYQSGGTYKYTITSIHTRKRWFEGAFKYWLPETSFGQNMSRWNKLWGVRPDPATLWNLAPWSWALDWVGDAGTLFENLSAFATDSLVMPWAYVMEESSTTWRHEVWYEGFFKSIHGPQYMRQELKTTTKRRVVASPYGFQLSWDTMSPRQLAIASSVGLTRS